MSNDSPQDRARQLTARLPRICIIGTGLIGGSAAAALKQAGYLGHIVGSGRSTETLERALELGLIDSFETSLADAMRGTSLVLLCVPMQVMGPILSALQQLLEPGAIVTDAGSVKQSFVNAAAAAGLDPAQVVPGHPIAGKEHSGVDAADPDLYRDHLVLLTPLVESDPACVDAVAALWQLCGARVENLAPDHHDRVLAATSHLPHVVAFTLVDMIASRQEREEIFRYSAGGFRDFTRIASGDPVMWRDVCLTNRDEVEATLINLQERLGDVLQLVQNEDADALLSLFQRARDAREKHIVHAKAVPAAHSTPLTET